VIDDLLGLLDGSLVDAVWTDPPYNVDYESGAGKIKNDALSDEAFVALLSTALVACFVVMREGAPIYVAHSDTGGYTFRRSFMDAGFRLASCLIWRKHALVLSRGDYHWQHEPILYGWKPGAAHRWYGARDKTTILEFDDPPFQQIGDDEWRYGGAGARHGLLRGQAGLEPGPSPHEAGPADRADAQELGAPLQRRARPLCWLRLHPDRL
jgi:DNA modification methylase